MPNRSGKVKRQFAYSKKRNDMVTFDKKKSANVVRPNQTNVEQATKESDNANQGRITRAALWVRKDLIAHSKKTRQIAYSSLGTTQRPHLAPSENNILEELSFAEHSAAMLLKSSAEPENSKGEVTF